MKNNEIIIIYQEVRKTPVFKKIKNNINEFEKILNGKIYVIPYKDIVIVCNKDRKHLLPNIYINKEFLNIGETIRGNIIIACRENEVFKSLTKEQIIKYLDFLKNASFHYDNADDNGNVILSNNKNLFKNFTKKLNLNDYEKIDTNINDETLKMILSIQSIILNFIKNNEN